MLLLPVWEWLEREAFNLPGEPDESRPLFNPYKDVNQAVDQPGADYIRRVNLRRYMESFSNWPEALVIGEAPGWRGCRFSGVPFTSEAQLNGYLPFCGARSSLGKRPHTEAAATIFWRVMRDNHPGFFVWNSLPMHPHLPGQPLSNRRPARDEIHQASQAVARLIGLLQPQRIIAVGRCAQAALQNLELEVVAVRHPSHGGAEAFEGGMKAAFKLP